MGRSQSGLRTRAGGAGAASHAATIALALAGGLLADRGLLAAPWLAITEIHYHPPGDEAEEFIEVLSREPPRADLAGWRIEGEVEFTFPPGATLGAGERLVVARDPQALRRRHPRLPRVTGPFAGRLDNQGGRVTLRNAAGARVAEVDYKSGGRWPVSPDGTGHSLSILDPLFDPASPESWAPSPRLGGTPGEANFPIPEGPRGSLLVRKGQVWRFWRGKTAPGPAWNRPGFDDSAWESGPSGFGFGDGDDATVLEDMQAGYLSLYTRVEFAVAGLPSLAGLILRIDYDDGFIASLNGKEIARANMGPEGRIPAFDQKSQGRREAGVPLEVDLGPAAALLVEGKNTLAVQVHNSGLDSSDLSLIVELESRKHGAAPTAEPRLLINEAAADFVEVFNAGRGEVDLGGHFLSDDPADLRKFKLPGPRPLAPGGFASIPAGELGAGFNLAADGLLLILTRPDGESVADALRLGRPRPEAAAAPSSPTSPSPPAAARAAGSRGHLPDGARDLAALDAPTPGAPNRAAVLGDLVINEIHYHSPAGDGDEFVEIHNRGAAPAALDGFRLGGGIRYEFAAGASIPPGGYLVIARDPAVLRSKYGLPKDRLAGPFRGRLADRGDEVLLRDPRGNVADRVEYADREPWPRWADGMGATLELVDPRLDNSIPAAWAASDDRDAARWETFTYTKEHRQFQGQNLSELQFMLLGEGECLIDDVHLRGPGGRELLADGSFERGAFGWSALGTHERSGLCAEAKEAVHGKKCYRIVAGGRGNARHNYVTLAIDAGLAPGQRYTLSFRARWLRGTPLLLSRTAGQGVAKTHRLSIPARLGTPGAENGMRRKDAPPAVGVPSQDPVSPSTAQAVTLGVRIAAVSAIESAAIHYRHEKDPGWREAPLADAGAGGRRAGPGLDLAAGDGEWTGHIPPLPAGRVEYFIRARDAAGREGTFPAAAAGAAGGTPGAAAGGAPARTALYASGLLPSRRFPTYTLLATDATWRSLAERPRMSNALVEGTLVYGDARIFHCVGFRRRGSPFTRSTRNWRIVLGAETLDGRRALTLDGQGGDGTRLNERLTYWLADQLRAPNVRQQYVYFRIPGQEEGLYEDVEKVDGRFLEDWFNPLEATAETGAAKAGAARKEKAAAARGGLLHRVDDHFELFPQGGQTYREAAIVARGPDPEDYRWNFPLRANSMEEDFEPLLQLLRLLDPRATPDRPFDERVEDSVDVDGWLRVLAARTLADDWDTLGRTRGKNALLYLSRADGRWHLLPWDCDLAWRSPGSPLFTGRFPAIDRLLGRPVHRRRFLGYLAFLCERSLDPGRFGAALADCRAHCGAATRQFAEFAAARREFVLDQIPQVPFRVSESRRVEAAAGKRGALDLVRAGGIAPPIALRFSLNGREGSPRFLDGERWTAEFPVGPEGGDLLLQALDFGGNEVARARVKVAPRAAAHPLPPLPEVPRFEPTEPPPPPVAGPASGDGAGSVPGPGTGPPPEPGPVPGPAEPRSEGRELVVVEPEGASPSPTATRAAGEVSGLRGRRGPAAEAAEPAAGTDLDVEAHTVGAKPAAAGRLERAPALKPAPGGLEGQDRSGAARPTPAAAGAPVASGSPRPPRAKGAVRFVLPAAVFAGTFLGTCSLLLLWRRLRRPAAGGKAGRALLHALGDPAFERAASALEHLSAAAIEEMEVPELIAALDDLRRTPFQRVLRAPDGTGLRALPASSPSGIRVCQVAALLLERLIGKPPIERPRRSHWQAHWEQSRKRGRSQGESFMDES